jgi:hypothetical protein
VFVTDAILATLMCASRSAYSWDIVVDKIGGKVKGDIFMVHFLTFYSDSWDAVNLNTVPLHAVFQFRIRIQSGQ